MEAPKRIYLSHQGECKRFDWDDEESIKWFPCVIHDSDIEYIRKDIYDKSQARIKQLEEQHQTDVSTYNVYKKAAVNLLKKHDEMKEALRFYSNDRNLETQLDIDMTGCTDIKVRERSGMSIEPFGATARNMLEKESE